MLNSGIYQIINIKTNKIYIGSTFDFNKRKREHFYKLENNIHHCIHLQNSYNKHGKNNFKFEVLVTCSKEYLLKLEQWFISNLKPSFNILKTAGSSLGFKHSEKTKLKYKQNIQEKKNKRITNKAIKLTYDDVCTIKKKIVLNYYYKDICEEYKINNTTLYNIKNKRIWKEVPDYIISENDIIVNRKIERKKSKYTDDFLVQIHKEITETNYTKKYIREKYNLTKAFDIVYNKKYN